MLQEFRKGNKVEKILLVFLLLIFLGQILWIAYINLFQLQYHMGYDASAYYLKSVEIVRQGTWFIKNWDEQTNLYLDSTVPLAAIMYKIVGNVFLAWGISNLIILLAVIACFNSILHYFCNKKISRLVALNLLVGAYNMYSVFVPNELGYSTMMYIAFSCYAVKMLLILLVMKNVLDVEHKKYNWILHICTLVLLFISGLSSGTYVLITAILPAMIYCIIKMLLENDLKKIPIKSLICLIIETIVLLGGKIYAAKVLGFVARDSALKWTGIDNFWKALGLFILGYPQALNAAPVGTNVDIMSLQGVSIALGWGICFLTVIGTFYWMYKVIKSKGRDKNGILLMCFYFVNTSIFVFAYMLYLDTAFEVRYMIPLMLMYFMGMAKWVDMLDNKWIASYFVMIIFVICILGVDVVSDVKLTKEKSNYDELKELADYVDEVSDTKLVYFIGDNIAARNMRVVDLSKVYKTVAEDGNFKHWGDYCYYDDPADYTGEAIVISYKDAIQNIPKYSNVSDFLDTTGDYSIYVIKNNSELAEAANE